MCECLFRCYRWRESRWSQDCRRRKRGRKFSIESYSASYDKTLVLLQGVRGVIRFVFEKMIFYIMFFVTSLPYISALRSSTTLARFTSHVSLSLSVQLSKVDSSSQTTGSGYFGFCCRSSGVTYNTSTCLSGASVRTSDNRYISSFYKQ